MNLHTEQNLTNFIESLVGKYSDKELENIAKKAFSDEKIKNLSEQGRDLKEEAALIMKKECSVLFKLPVW